MISSTRPRCNYPLDFIETLRNWANSPQAEKDLETVFGQALHWPAAYRHLDAFRRGDFSLLPPVEVLEDAAMPGLWGGYSRDLRLVFLSADCPEDLILPVLLEEIGHFFDQEFCKEETPGDEGVVFAALVLGQAIEPEEVVEDALRELSFEGSLFLVEAAPKVRGSAKTKVVAQPKVRGNTSSKVVSDTTTSQDGTVVYANKDSVRLVQTKANQSVIGSKGNDTFVVTSQNVRLEDPNGGTDTVETSVSFSLSNFSFIENLTAVSGTAALSLTGNAKANIITGNSGNNVLDGGLDSQKDTLIGGAGNDTYIIRDSLDVISDSSGTDVIFTTNQSLSLSSYTNIESIVFIGTDGADSMTGGAGAGTLMGGRGNDTYFVDNALDSVSETDSLTLTGGVDWVNTRINYALGSNVENLFKTGNANVSLTGNELGNLIDGSAGGVNTLSGGDGNDTLIVNTARYGSLNGGNGGTDIDILRLVGTSLNARNPAFTDIEILDLSLLTGSASVTLNSAAIGLETLIASSFNDTIDASAFNSNILIDASAGSGSRLIGATGAGLVNTLIGGANGGNNFVLDAIGTNSLVGGFGGLDTLTIVSDGVTLVDDDFRTLSSIGTLKLEGGYDTLAEVGNTVTLGDNALIAGIRTLVGGEGDDLGVGNTFDTSAYGSAGVLFQVTDQNYLANITTIIGGTGADTLKFSRDGVSVTDENVDNLWDIDVIQTANGTNRFLMHNAFYTAGIDSIIGGTGSNIIDMSSGLYIPFNAIATNFDDVITFDMSAGSYTLIVNSDELRYAKVVGGEKGGNVSILAVTPVLDIGFENLYDAKISEVSISGADIELGENAMASGLSILNIEGATAYVSDFNAPLVVNGADDSDERVFTSFAALADLTFNGGTGMDTLQIEDSDARAITSLDGDFDVLVLEEGKNFVSLGNDAGLSVIVGGTGADTLNFLANTTGINFVMNATVLGDTDNFAMIMGGSGSDTLTARNLARNFIDTQFTRASSIENFETDLTPQTYIFGTTAYATGIENIYAFSGDIIDASGFTAGVPASDRALNFIFWTEADLAGATITGTGATANDTLTLTTDAQTVTDTTFANHSSVETLVLANGANSVTLDSDAQTAGIKTVIGGTGIDQFTKINATVTTLVGGSGNDVFNYSTKAIFAADSLDGGTGSNSIIFSTDAQIFIDTDFDRIAASTIQSITTANGANNLTLGANAVAAGIATVTGGTGDDTFDATAYTIASTLSGDAGNDSLLSGTGNDSLTGGNGTDWLQGTSASSKGVGQFDTLTGGAGIDTFILGDSGFAYYNSTETDTPVDYAVITDFANGDLLQLKTIDNLEAGNGYIVLGVGGSKYQLYLDTDKSDAYNSGDNLIAEITSSVALTTVNLKSTHGSFV